VVKQAAQAENLRKLLLAIVTDIRVLLVKLADRLHNMRTIAHLKPEKRARIAEETLEIYAPLAGRMGMQGMRDELEDLAFQAAYPEAYTAIVSRLEALRKRLDRDLGTSEGAGDVIASIESEIARRLRAANVEAMVKGRQKRPYSIYRKAERQSVEFEQLSDIYGFRVVVNDVPACYQALGVLHTTFRAVPGRYKDYISNPKQNDYRSIHTTVIGPGAQRVEMQIRTHEMNRVAEFGIAAHSLYKDGVFVRAESDGHVRLTTESTAYRWLADTVKQLSESSTPEEFLEHTKLELFHDQVFCFSPKGKLIPLPRGATPIDFAYAVHTELGNECVGARVNGRQVALSSELKNGDEVHIVRSKGASPPSAWEAIAVTGKARYEIRKATRAAIRTQYANLGKTIVKRAFERAEKTFSVDRVEAVVRRLARASAEDVFAAVGRGEMTTNDVLRAVYPDFRQERAASPQAPGDAGWIGVEGGRGMKFRPSDGEAGVPVRGLDRALPVRFAPGGAVPGDRIVGIMMPGEGITIYPIDSPALEAFDDIDPDRWIDVRWDVDPGDRDQRFPARVQLTTVNEPGTLAEIARVIAENDGNIDNVKMSRVTGETTDMLIDLEVFDVKHLNAIVGQLKTKSVVSAVRRSVG
jgi:GTP diphosphokinase / guanosine-3',5'-bis(diphosphate) 3'-diphosphatase